MGLRRDMTIEAVSQRYLESHIEGPEMMMQLEVATSGLHKFMVMARHLLGIIGFQRDYRAIKHAYPEGENLSDHELVAYALQNLDNPELGNTNI